MVGQYNESIQVPNVLEYSAIGKIMALLIIDYDK